jgi:hypothetical protein
VDYHRVVTVEVEDANLEQRTVCARSDQHRQLLIESDPPHGVPDRMQHVTVTDRVLPGRFADPHLDNLRCLTTYYNADRGQILLGPRA